MLNSFFLVEKLVFNVWVFLKQVMILEHQTHSRTKILVVSRAGQKKFQIKHSSCFLVIILGQNRNWDPLRLHAFFLATGKDSLVLILYINQT